MSEALKIHQSFPTWSFDQACQTMEWNRLVETSLTVTSDIDNVEKADLVIVGVMGSPTASDGQSSGEEVAYLLEGTAKKIDVGLGGGLAELLEENLKTFKNGAKMGSLTPSIRVVGQNAKRYAILGLGPSKTAKLDSPDWKSSGMVLGKAIATACEREKKIASATVLLPQAFFENVTAVQDFSTYFYQTLYSDNRYRTGDRIKKPVENLSQVTLISETGAVDASSLTAVIETGKKYALGAFLAKDIVNAPHNVLNSESLAETAKRVATESNGCITCTILEKDECEKLGMGSYLSVARGSETRPQFIHLKYTPPSGIVKRKIGIVGKGLLFDTGGYNIKTQLMELMKFDCGGAAATIGGARIVGDLQPDGVEAHFFVAACENMISDKAYVPQDILTAMNGKTVEVLNTDAEGRLTLADALCFADTEVGCEKIIELSTLTGTSIAFMGRSVSPYWTEDDDLATEVEAASKEAGDKIWRAPLEKECAEQLESMIADLKNIGGRWGGPIHAAVFLTNFVDPKKPFAHIDMAGPVWDDKLGATGWGAKLVASWVLKNSSM